MPGPGSAQVFLADAFPAQVFISDINGAFMANFVGKAIRIANWAGPVASPIGGFRNSSGALYDPTSPAFKYRLAGLAEATISGGSLTHDGTGLYSAVITPTVDGALVVTAISGDGAYADPVTTKIEPAPL